MADKEKKQVKDPKQSGGSNVDITPDFRVDPNYDYRVDLEKLATGKKRARRWIGLFSLLISAFVIISFLGYLVAQEQASAATIRLTNRAKEISLTEVGFRVEVPLTASEQETYGLVPDVNNEFYEKKIYWTTNRISQKTFKFLVTKSGFPEGLSLAPVTTRDFKRGDDIVLYNSYSGLNRYERHLVQETVASHYNYFGFNILFKVNVKNSDDLANYPIYFTPNSSFQGYNAIDEGVRLGFTSDITTDIIRPVPYKTNQPTEASIAVGGRYDFERQLYDGSEDYYDYTDLAIDGKYYEIAFGDFEEELTDDFWYDTPAVATNESGPKTAPGVYGFNSDLATAKRQYFKNSFRYYSNIQKVGQHIALTNANGIAELDVKIWLEGWDPASTSDVDGINFEANIGFEVYDKEQN